MTSSWSTSKQEYVDKGLGNHSTITWTKLVSKERMSQEDADATLARISLATDRSVCADCDLVVEAVPEILDLKTSIFAELDGICKPETILASNTSSISISTIADATNRPDRVIGMHFMNPVPIMKLVEVINGEKPVQKQMLLLSKHLLRWAKLLYHAMIHLDSYQTGFSAQCSMKPF